MPARQGPWRRHSTGVGEPVDRHMPLLRAVPLRPGRLQDVCVSHTDLPDAPRGGPPRRKGSAVHSAAQLVGLGGRGAGAGAGASACRSWCRCWCPCYRSSGCLGGTIGLFTTGSLCPEPRSWEKHTAYVGSRCCVHNPSSRLQCGTMTNRVIDNLFGLACVCVCVCARVSASLPCNSVPPLVHHGY